MVSHDFPWLATREEGLTMLIYYNAIVMKQGPCSIFCAGAFMSHHDSALFHKAEATSLRTGCLSCMAVLYLSPGAPPEFPPSRLSPASVLLRTRLWEDAENNVWSMQSLCGCDRQNKSWGDRLSIIHWQLLNGSSWTIHLLSSLGAVITLENYHFS